MTAVSGVSLPISSKIITDNSPVAILRKTALSFSFQKDDAITTGATQRVRLSRVKRSSTILERKIAINIDTTARMISERKIIFARRSSVLFSFSLF